MEKYLSSEEIVNIQIGKKYKKTNYGGGKVFIKQEIRISPKNKFIVEVFLYNGKWQVENKDRQKIIKLEAENMLDSILTKLNKKEIKRPIKPDLDIEEYRKIYDDYADADELGYYEKSSPEYVRVKDILSMIKKNSLVYDAGCNSGGIGKILIKEKKCHVSGSEICLKLARIARKNGIETFCGLAEKTPFLDNYFDYSIVSFILEHVMNPEEVIKETCRILKAGGKMIGHVPTEFGDWGKHTIGIHPEHIRAYTKEDLIDLLNKFNLKNITIKEERLVGRKIADYYFFHAIK